MYQFCCEDIQSELRANREKEDKAIEDAAKAGTSTSAGEYIVSLQV